ncbi:MAG: response regulator [Candidatus Aenigmarchaeota archaeon]|nr:response regulator [Candidatus Aenigmarchaeota archaeon]
MPRQLNPRGYEFLCYAQGGEAIHDIERGLRYDIAVVDLSLPDIDGIRVMTISREKHEHTPVICASGYKLKPECADAFLNKPYLIRDLMSLLDHYLVPASLL